MQFIRAWLRRVNLQLWQVRHKLGLTGQSGQAAKETAGKVEASIAETIKEQIAARARFTKNLYRLVFKFTLPFSLAVGTVVAIFNTHHMRHISDTEGWVHPDNFVFKKTTALTKKTLNSFVWTFDPVHKMLVDILCSQVFANQRIEFLLARSLNRVIAMDFIQDELKTLTKESVLKESVLYSPEIYSLMKDQLVSQFRSDSFRDLIKDQTVTFTRTDVARSLIAEQMGDTLRLKPVVESFVEGVVDSSIYGMLESKENARKLDNQLYEILK